MEKPMAQTEIDWHKVRWQEMYDQLSDDGKEQFDKYMNTVGPMLLGPQPSPRQENEIRCMTAFIIAAHDDLAAPLVITHHP
jgi:hypothetical protein